MKELRIKKTKSLTIRFVCEADRNEVAEKRLCEALAKIITAPVEEKNVG